MDELKNYIDGINQSGRKVLSIYLTTGFPDKDSFVDLALGVFESGADIIEMGVPFSDPLADGSVIQQSSHAALENGITLDDIFNYAAEIKKQTDKKLVLMSYLNPITNYGLDNFVSAFKENKFSGLILPDLPIDEYDDDLQKQLAELGITFLTTPTSSNERIKRIDELSTGFVYCVSVAGITGTRNDFGNNILPYLEKTYKLITKNKMLIGFGISKPEHVKQFKDVCDGVIVGSAVIKSLMNDEVNFRRANKMVKELSSVCNNDS
ncbi:MAG: tryptophan synthase subunit alpha [Ignavibacteria bacterium]